MPRDGKKSGYKRNLLYFKIFSSLKGGIGKALMEWRTRKVHVIWQIRQLRAVFPNDTSVIFP